MSNSIVLETEIQPLLDELIELRSTWKNHNDAVDKLREERYNSLGKWARRFKRREYMDVRDKFPAESGTRYYYFGDLDYTISYFSTCKKFSKDGRIGLTSDHVKSIVNLLYRDKTSN